MNKLDTPVAPPRGPAPEPAPASAEVTCPHCYVPGVGKHKECGGDPWPCDCECHAAVPPGSGEARGPAEVPQGTRAGLAGSRWWDAPNPDKGDTFTVTEDNPAEALVSIRWGDGTTGMWERDKIPEMFLRLDRPPATPEVPQGPVEAAGRRVRWRVGRSVGRTLYLDNVLVGLMDDASLARTVVTALTEMGQRIDGEAGNDAATAARLQAHAEGRAEAFREAIMEVRAQERGDRSGGVAGENLRHGIELAARAIERLAASPPQPLACACVETRYHGGECSARPDDGERACASCIEYGHDVSTPAKETP